MNEAGTKSRRRDFLVQGMRALLAAGLGVVTGRLLWRRGGVGAACPGGTCGACPEAGRCILGGVGGVGADRLVWQLDPRKCIRCGRCATECVLAQSAVRCVHSHDMCGYCKLCFGYFVPGAPRLDEGAENQVCPTGAIRRRFVEDPYFEYRIDEALCIGCGKCVEGCTLFGNGSLYLQVRHDLCLNCNECAIARSCPADAFVRVPADRPYLLKPELEPDVPKRSPLSWRARG